MRSAVLFLLATVGQAQNWTWRATAPLNQGRADACAVSLADGRVLVSGGSGTEVLSSVEIFASAPEEAFTPAAALSLPRSGHGCALLKDGRIIVAGGGAASVELYEPALDAWTQVESRIFRKAGTTVLPLADGRVLIAGGQAVELEIFEPETSTLTLLNTAVELRDRQTVTMLRDGRILFAGGTGPQGALNSAEVFDPVSGEVTPAPAMSAPRMAHSATALLDGRVLIAGGSNGQSEVNTLEVYLPESNRFQVLAATLKEARQSHVALLVPFNGQVLLAGGLAAASPIATSELFNPAEDSVFEAGSLTAARSGIAGVLLEDGAILAAGGRNSQGPSAACGVLPSPSFRFTQTVYHPLERAIVSGSLGIAGVSTRVTFDLTRVDAAGKSTSINNRLLAPSAQVTNGNLPATSIVDVFRDDIGSDFILTIKATISSTQTVSVQARFSAKLRTTLQVFTLTGATVAGQAAPVRTILTADGSSVMFSGSWSVTLGGATASQSISRAGASVTIDASICCPSVGRPEAGGAAVISASYGGNLFLEPSSATGSHLIVGKAPILSFSAPLLQLAVPASIPVTVTPSGPPIPSQVPGGIDPILRPTGTVTLTLNNTAMSSATLQGPSTLVVTPVPIYPSAQATLSYTPTIVDRRAGSVCAGVNYSGDSRYIALPLTPNTAGSGSTIGDGSVRTVGCSAVGPAPSVLQVLTPPANYALGAATPFSVRLTWPNSVGIVGRNVTMLADGRPAGTIPLTPDRTGLGVATGTSSIVLPFNTRNLTFAYDASGDLAASQTTSTITMAAVTTSITSLLPSTVTNPFTIPVTLSFSNRGVAIPAGTSTGGSIEFRDGDTVIGTVPVPALASGPGITDGSSNTLLLSETSIQVPVALTNVIRPLGTHTITARFTGGPQFLASQTQATVRVQ